MTMTTTHEQTTTPLPIEAEELVGIAGRIRAWQHTRQLSDNQVVRRLPGLGSTKTYTRILRGDLAELDLDRWLTEYRAVWAQLEHLAERTAEEEPIYDDLTPVLQLRRALVSILEETSIRRVVLLEGDSGMGKTGALRQLQGKYGQRIVVVEATDVWGDSANAFLGAILAALGVREPASGRAERLLHVVSLLNARRVALAVDEAHHLGPHCLNTLKTLVNQTPSEVVLVALPKLWRCLERSAWEEVRQLLGNRLAERIRLADLRAGDVAKLLERRCPGAGAAAAQVAEPARTRGNLSFVAAVARRLADTREADDGPLSPEAVAAAIAAEVGRR